MGGGRGTSRWIKRWWWKEGKRSGGLLARLALYQQQDAGLGLGASEPR